MIRHDHCEISVTHHCNLSCRSCSHLSPVMKRSFVDAGRVRADLATLAPYYHVDAVRLLGGEPLLHPDLAGVIRAVRESGVGDSVEVWTNGMLLPRMPQLFWESVDRVMVSSYPGAELSVHDIWKCFEAARAAGTSFSISHADVFRESHAEIPTTDDDLRRRVYATCLSRHCHNVEAGYFYKCPQAFFVSRLLADESHAPTKDGVRLADSPTFAEELAAYLASPEPLHACRYCLGSIGRKIESTQVPRAGWRDLQRVPYESLVDSDLLTSLERSIDGAVTYRAARPRKGYGLWSRWRVVRYMWERHGMLEAFRSMLG